MRTVKVQLDSVTDTKLPGIKMDNCFYSETGCSFARHFAILSRNVGILIGSLLRASCDSNFNLLPEQTVFHIGIL